MARKWLISAVAAVLGVIAVLALVLGGVVGRSIVPSPTTTTPPSTERFTDTLTDVSIAYPSGWERLFPKDQSVRLVAASPDGSAGVSVSVRRSGLEPVTATTLPLVRSLTDGLLRADKRIRELPEPVAISIHGLPGYRYVYSYRMTGGRIGAHIHYFFFDGDRLIQVVLQAVPASGLEGLRVTFDRIAGTLRTRHE